MTIIGYNKILVRDEENPWFAINTYYSIMNEDYKERPCKKGLIIAMIDYIKR